LEETFKKLDVMIRTVAYIVFSWEFGPVQLTIFKFHPFEAGFYKPTVLKVHPPFFRIIAYATMLG
jgi:hypothetical protein